MLTVKEAADRIGVSPSLIYSLCQAGLIVHTRHGRPGKRGAVRISDEALKDYLDSCKVKPKASHPVPGGLRFFGS